MEAMDCLAPRGQRGPAELLGLHLGGARVAPAEHLQLRLAGGVAGELRGDGWLLMEADLRDGEVYHHADRGVPMARRAAGASGKLCRARWHEHHDSQRNRHDVDIEHRIRRVLIMGNGIRKERRAIFPGVPQSCSGYAIKAAVQVCKSRNFVPACIYIYMYIYMLQRRSELLLGHGLLPDTLWTCGCGWV